MGIGSRKWGSGVSGRLPARKARISGGARICWVSLILLFAAFTILQPFRHYSSQVAANLAVPPSPSPKASFSSKSKPDAQGLLGQLPMIFEPNQGQADPSVKFVSRGQGYNLYLQEDSAVLALARGQHLQDVRMTLAGATSPAEISGTNRLPGTSNYFIGNDPKKWHRGIPQFAGVHYQSVYPGIDLVFYGSQGRLEYDFRVAPGADPLQAQLQFEGVGKAKLSRGDLLLDANGANVRLQAPQIYQNLGNRRQRVTGRFVLRAANRVGFEIGPYDHSRELVIDPIISYSTYFGGSTPAGAVTNTPYVAVNGNGFIYLTGSTTATDLVSQFPALTNAFQSTLNGAQNIFILELSPSAAGTAQVIYLTYLGGSGTDTAAGIGVDTGGNAYVAGSTTSPNFPAVNAFQSKPVSTGTHVFVSEISQITATTPTLSYSTYLSGTGTDIASGMAIDTNHNVFVTGTTTSVSSNDVASGFPSTKLPVPFQQNPSPGAPIQFFVSEVNTLGIAANSMAYSTYFGGATWGTTSATDAINNNKGGGITVDSVENVYFSGTTNFYNSQETLTGGSGQPTDFPVLNAYQPCLDTPPPITLIPPVTCSATGLPTPYPTDAFVAKLNPVNAQSGAAQLLFSTYFGGAQTDTATAIAIDSSNVYITGSTNSGVGGTTGFVIPTNSGPFQSCLNTPPPNPSTCTTTTSATDAYVARFTNPTEATGTTTSTTPPSLGYFSYLGGSANDGGLAIAVDTAEGALVTGFTQSGTLNTVSPTTGFPVTTGAIQPTLKGTQNAFFAHINTTTTTTNTTSANYSTYFGGNGIDRGTSITVDPSLNTYFAGDTTSSANLQVQNPLQSTLQGAQDAFVVRLQPVANLCITCIPPVLNPSSGAVGAGNPITATFTLTNQGPDLATNVTVSGQLAPGTAATFNPASTNSGTCSVPTGATATCLIPTLQAGSTTSVVFSATPTAAGNGAITATVSAANINTNLGVVSTASFQATSFGLNVQPSSQTVVAGQTATYTVLVSPVGTFGNNVALSCSSLPVGASCGFNPSTLTFNGPGAQASTLSLTTTQRPPVTISSTKWRGTSYAFWVMAPGIAWMGLGSKKRKRGRIVGWFAFAAVFLFFALQPACSRAKEVIQVTGTPAGTYPLTVTATSGSFTQSAVFTLTVQ
jgi:uncharacterized repeat protein (TIGR01451 family)